VFHEDLEGDVIGDDGLAGSGGNVGVVSDAWVDFALQEAFLGTSVAGNDKLRNGESFIENDSRIVFGLSEQLLDAGILFLVLIARIVPGLDSFSSPNNNVEETIEEQDNVGFQARGV